MNIKRFIAAVLSVSIVLTSYGYVFAQNSTSSAISLNDRLKLAELSGVATPSSAMQLAASVASDTSVFLNGYSYTSNTAGLTYYFNGSSVANTSLNFSTLPDLFHMVTYSTAHSISNLYSSLRTLLNSLDGHVDGIEGSLTSIVNSIGTTVGSTLTTISSRVNTTNSRLSTTNSTLGDILTAIENQSFTIPQSLLDDVDLLSNNSISKSSIQPWIIPSDDYDHSSSEWRYYFRTYLNNNGLLSTSDFYNTNILMLYKRALSDISNNTGYLGNRTISGVIGSGINYPLYNSDLTSSNMSKTSIWKNILELGSNISLHLSRLSYVLASDDEIAARAAAADTQAAAVTNFVSPSADNSLGASDIGDISNIASSYSDILDSDVNPSAAFGSMSGDSDAWQWFTSEVADSLDTTQRHSNLRSIKNDSSLDYPLVNNNLDELQKILGVKLW